MAGDHGRSKAVHQCRAGAILTGPMRETARGFANQREVSVRGSHFVQEDSGTEIGKVIS
jgi:haloalkane dehalogenase